MSARNTLAAKRERRRERSLRKRIHMAKRPYNTVILHGVCRLCEKRTWLVRPGNWCPRCLDALEAKHHPDNKIVTAP